ncbi:MAG: hypothetical protein JMN27_17125 [gamma proteobacterium endosymbiont of Lamellibrachia anaximandri]|nr:hypothetical protein [gamma proteobacterium endosymbiont of Lamellibrachia anaximandri]MBL3535529.1 hypothetical protein [gamma proteobacterium endosymbiont of Lamellibrachia anaximandri]
MQIFFTRKTDNARFIEVLRTFGLDQGDIDPAAYRKITQGIHERSNSAHKKFHIPKSKIIEDHSHTAAIAVTYCLLGPNEAAKKYPGLQDEFDEVEEDLVNARVEANSHSIHLMVFSILRDQQLCHPDALLSVNERENSETNTPHRQY